MKSKFFTQVFVASESVFFAALLVSYAYLGLYKTHGPASVQSLNAFKTGLYSIALFSSSFTMWMARRNFIKKNYNAVKAWLLGTIILGSTFIFGEGSEYIELYKDQVTMSRDTFGSAFFTITGFHGMHVTLGLLVLCITLGLITFGDIEKFGISTMESVEVYWHFVDGVWVFVFTVIYLIPHII
ncbi:MAG TPA: heme-copper oxidase subunit III [Balneolaceae bacterium]|nr:heme-copper oxidase subunit III [Balneolaceae bacterium]